MFRASRCRREMRTEALFVLSVFMTTVLRPNSASLKHCCVTHREPNHSSVERLGVFVF